MDALRRAGRFKNQSAGGMVHTCWAQNQLTRIFFVVFGSNVQGQLGEEIGVAQPMEYNQFSSR